MRTKKEVSKAHVQNKIPLWILLVAIMTVLMYMGTRSVKLKMIGILSINQSDSTDRQSNSAENHWLALLTRENSQSQRQRVRLKTSNEHLGNSNIVKTSKPQRTKVAVKALLTDVTEKFLSGPFSEETSEKRQTVNKIRSATHKIVWFNKPSWILLPNTNKCLKTCSYTNCEFVASHRMLKNSSAVIFCMSVGGIGKTPPLELSERPAGQVWIFFAMEPPIYLDKFYRGWRPTWKNSLNWSMNYRLDSDIIVPYGYLTSRKILPRRNYTEIFRQKIRFAAWVVSNCETHSSREKYVEKLMKYGLEIDIYGDCGEEIDDDDPKEIISKNYKFYLSFENSFCTDYVTEKFFRYYPLNAVMVVRGGADYKKLIPNNTYIDTADFKSVDQLVNYLKLVGSNETLYTDYLRRKDKYDTASKITDNCLPFCALCRKLNNLKGNVRTYENVPKYLETCRAPDDI